MAEIRGVWGIDIGLAGLKAIRLVYAEAARQVLATHFDYIPHPKILSQPDANPEELIAQALDLFLSRNKLEGDSVAISVPGQSALARFIQLPPVEASKVGEIVKYEARQQIPFALEDVIWDYQSLGAGSEAGGFLIEAEVGLFAMKRDQVQQHLAPFVARKVEVDLIQIAPLALYNFLCHDRFGYVPGSSSPVEQPDYTLVLDMGADNTTLLVSNGKKIWIRNVPLGGNHFTRALTKEMKLTFAKAEHLKCNATKSPDPKAVFQALRPVFNDYVAEIQRSIGYFSSVNRDARIGRILGVGNGFKLAGLQKFLQQSLQMEVERFDGFQSLAGDAVLNAPLFQEYVQGFAVPHGLALQGLKITRVHTSLLPPEITTARMVRRKKPWAVTAAAALLAGLTLSTLGYSYVWGTVSEDRFKDAEAKAKSATDEKNRWKSAYTDATSKNATLKKDLESLLGSNVGRTYWLEIYKAIEACLPRDYGAAMEEQDPTKRNRIRILGITCEKTDKLDEWFKNLSENAKSMMREDDAKNGPTGSGYVFTLQGAHFHYDEEMTQTTYIAETLLANLKQWFVQENDLATQQPTRIVPVRQIGIKWPTITASSRASTLYFPGGPAAAAEARGERGVVAGARVDGLPGARPAKKKKDSATTRKDGKKLAEEGNPNEGVPIKRTAFTVQFVWQETPLAERKAEDPSLPNPAQQGSAGAVPVAGQPAATAPSPPPPPPAGSATK